MRWPRHVSQATVTPKPSVAPSVTHQASHSDERPSRKPIRAPSPVSSSGATTRGHHQFMSPWSPWSVDVVVVAAVVASGAEARAGTSAREPIARAAHGFDHGRSARRLERVTQALDVHVDRALFDEDVVAPDAVEQLRARVHALGVRHQEVQQLEFGRPHAHLDAADT